MNMKEFDLLSAPLSGVNLVEASAGTGKTYNIAGLYVRFLLEKKLSVNQILVVTFTNAATYELKQRIYKRIKTLLQLLRENSSDNKDGLFDKYIQDTKHRQEYIELLKRAVLSFDESAIFTIHGFCNKVLRENAFESRVLFSMEMEGDSSKIIDVAVDDYFRMNFIDFDEQEEMLIKASGLLGKKWELKDFLKKISGFYSAIEKLREECSYDFEGYFRLEKRLKDLHKKIIDNMESYFSYIDKKIKYKSTISAIKKRIMSISAPLQDIKIDNYIQKNIQKFPEDIVLFFDLLTEYRKCIDGFIDYHKKKLAVFFYDREEKIKAERGISTYNDLLKKLFDVLNSRFRENLQKILRTKFSVAMIDESQDTDLLQFDIFKRLFIENRVDDSCCYFIGDPKQSIYAFRGADIFAYMSIKKIIKEPYTLNKNWRSNKRLINTFNEVFNTERPFIFDEIEYIPIDYPVNRDEDIPELSINEKTTHFCIIESKKKEDSFEDIANRIKSILKTGKIGSKNVREEDIAILVRSNLHIEALHGVLVKKGINVVSPLKSDVFKSAEAEIAKNIFRLVENTGNINYLKQFLLSRLSSLDENKAINLEEYPDLLSEEVTKWSKYREVLLKKGIMAFYYSLIEKEHILSNLSRYPGAERSITNLNHIFEVLQENFFKKAGNISRILGFFDDEKRESQELRLESDENAVRITTFHSCKGLEFPVVFVYWNEYGPPLPYFHDDKSSDIVIEMSENMDRRAEELMAERLRLFYVAVTRAKTACFVYDVKKKDYNSVIPYLKLLERAERLKEKDVEFFGSEIFEEVEYKRKLEDVILASKKFTREKIDNIYGLYSYSGITFNHDSIDEEIKPTIAGPESGEGIFDFPAGSKSGLFFHEILEEIDFTADTEIINEIVLEKLEKYGFDGEEWREVIMDTLQAVLDFRLDNRFSLRGISEKDRLSELEFYFPVSESSKENIISAFNGYSGKLGNIENLLKSLNINSIKGFMSGFIDLVFRHEGKYYLIDWKSNLIGKGYEYFDDVGMGYEIRKHLYFMQYYLYSIALHRFLKSKISDYDFEKHFGGIYYVFLRGVDAQRNTGIFTEKIDKVVLDKLDGVFK